MQGSICSCYSLSCAIKYKHNYVIQVYQYHHYYPNYLWIVPGWYSDNWWMEFSSYLAILNCTVGQVEQVLNRSLTFMPVPESINLTTNGVNTTFLTSSRYAADAVRALAQATNSTISEEVSYNMSCELVIKSKLSNSLLHITNPSGISVSSSCVLFIIS